MTANSTNIWRVPVYLPYLQPPLTARALADAEAMIGYKLPSELTELLRAQNGGYIRYSLPNSVHRSIAGIGPKFPSLTRFDWTDAQDDVSFSMDGLVPFDGDGHWHICLDYRENANSPSVTYIDVECDSQSPIAPSFAEYLRLLFVDHRDQLAVCGFRDFESALAAIGKALNATFSAPDSWAHGYPISRASLNGGSDWCWLSPNQVRHGFVRDDDPMYESLKDVLPDLVLRYPELSADAYILHASEGARTLVRNACSTAGLSITPLSKLIQDPAK